MSPMKLTTALIAFFAYLFTIHPKNAIYNPEMAAKVAEGISQVTQEPWEAETLARIARWESNLSKDVANCTIKGKLGERGLFQVIPRSKQEKIDLCSDDYSVQARIALSIVHESIEFCKKKGIKGADGLGMYTSGKCYKGNVYAAFRYGDGTKLRSMIEADGSK